MKQIIFYSITEAELADHRLLARGIGDVASRGFDGIYIEFRNIRSGYSSLRLMRALRAACDAARARGMGVVLDAALGRLSDTIRDETPEAFCETWIPYRVAVRRGCFTISVRDELQGWGVERCWQVAPPYDGRSYPWRDVTAHLESLPSVIEGGGCAMTAKKGCAMARLKWRVRGLERGDLFLVARRRFEFVNIDLSHPAIRRYTVRRLKEYRYLPVAGFAWDEPHFGFAFWTDNGRAISENLLRIFRRRFGYDLCDRLPDLWWDLPDGRSAVTRLHYAELLEQALADLESYFQRRARGWLGESPDAFVGIHRTMHEETGDDFLIGCADYFRHNRHTLGAFTDSVFEREDSMLTMLHMARSLAAANGGPAWNNSWGFQPRERHHAYYLRLMGAMQVRWIGHTYHSSHLFGPGYPDHPLWAGLRPHLSVQRRMLDALEGARPVVDAAIFYNWRAMAGFAGNYLHVHRRNLLLLGKSLTFANVQFQFVDETGLRRESGWRRVIVPWPDLLPPGAIARLAELADHGSEIFFFGPPALRDAGGRTQGTAFAELCGIEPIPVGAETSMREGAALRCGKRSWTLDPLRIESNYRSNERSSYPDSFNAYRLAPRRGTVVRAFYRGKPVGVTCGRVTYMACELPHFAGLPEFLIDAQPLARISPGWLVFAYERGSELLLAGVSRNGQPRSLDLAWRGRRWGPGAYAAFVATPSRLFLRER